MTKAATKRAVVAGPPVEAEEGKAMKALPNDRWREFVRQSFVVKPGHGAAVRAARAAGFEGSTPESMATIASRLMHDERILLAMREYGEQFLKGAAPAALRALQKLILTPGHKGHERAVASVVDRMYPVETKHVVEVEHSAAASMKATAEVFARIMALAARANVAPMIDVTPKTGEAA